MALNLERRDVIAPANFVSAAGITLVAMGLKEGLHTRKGIAFVAAGRILDLLDGPVARKTNTCSELGATIDATLDKAGIALILKHEYNNGFIPAITAAGIAGQNLLNTAATMAAKAKHPGEELTPVTAGKRAMFAQSLGVGMFAISAATKSSYPKFSRAVYHMANGTAGIGTYEYGRRATRAYISRATS